MQAEEENPGRILARRSGMMIAVRILHETERGAMVSYADNGVEVWISKANRHAKLFPDTDQAMAWIEGDKA